MKGVAKAYVGVSGGVDSSVSAALLKEEGYDVTGVFIRVWQPPFLECSWRDERTDAKRVCAQLGIPFLELDLSERYKKEVVDYMVREYARGVTPNPDVMCNAHIKFGAFFDTARAAGADVVTTGHYAQVVARRGVGGSDVVYEMHMGADLGKDQSYFLWTLTQAHLRHTRFPIGNLQKSEVRTLAKKFGLHTAEKKDSQGVCFLGKLDMREFLKHFIEEKPGEVLNEAGETIGHHDGAAFFTIGQRHGFTITKKTPTDKPYYIIAKDVERNAITVSMEPKAQPDTLLVARDTNWVSGTPHVGEVLLARLRYRQPLFEVVVKRVEGDHATFEQRTPHAFIPVGQSLVLYQGDQCLGGGVLE